MSFFWAGDRRVPAAAVNLRAASLSVTTAGARQSRRSQNTPLPVRSETMTEVFEDYAEVTVLVSRRLIEDMVRDGQTAALDTHAMSEQELMEGEFVEDIEAWLAARQTYEAGS
jgi:hypothetical protein